MMNNYKSKLNVSIRVIKTYLLVVSLILMSDAIAQTSSSGAQIAKPVTDEMVNNATLKLFAESHEVTFRDGECENEQGLWKIQNKTFGDLNKDNINDAAFIVCFIGTSASDCFLYAMIGTGEKPFVTDPALFDSTRGFLVKSFNIKNDKIVIEGSAFRYKSGDANCCPSIEIEAVRTYDFQRGRLVELGIKYGKKKENKIQFQVTSSHILTLYGQAAPFGIRQETLMAETMIMARPGWWGNQWARFCWDC